MEWGPTASAEVESEATPPLNMLVPRTEAPSMKVTWVEGVPAAGGFAVTVAVKVTELPKKEGFAELPTTVVVLALFTTWFSVADVQEANVRLPG